MNLTTAEHKRFMGRVKTSGKGCWLWTGPLDKDGYGTFFLRRLPRRAHRVAWYMEFGEIPEDMYIDHTCQNRHCVNPDHLRTVTPRANSLTHSNSPAAKNAAKTTCANGHPYDRAYPSKKGGVQRYCSICEAAKSKRLRAKWRAENTLRV